MLDEAYATILSIMAASVGAVAARGIDRFRAYRSLNCTHAHIPIGVCVRLYGTQGMHCMRLCAFVCMSAHLHIHAPITPLSRMILI